MLQTPSCLTPVWWINISKICKFVTQENDSHDMPYPLFTKCYFKDRWNFICFDGHSLKACIFLFKMLVSLINMWARWQAIKRLFKERPNKRNIIWRNTLQRHIYIFVKFWKQYLKTGSRCKHNYLFSRHVQSNKDKFSLSKCLDKFSLIARVYHETFYRCI